jgi:hypothetical protein
MKDMKGVTFLLEIISRLRYMVVYAPSNNDLLLHLYHLRQFRASDARDKVWVAIMLVDDTSLWHYLVLDYLMSLHCTYKYIVLRYLAQEQNLDIL